MQNQSVLELGTLNEIASDAPLAFQTPQTVNCAFCGLGQGQIAQLFEGRAGFICDECVAVCAQLLNDYAEMGMLTPNANLPWYKRWLSNVKNDNQCSFSYHDRNNPQGDRLFPGAQVQICNHCVRLCELLKTDSNASV